MVIQSQGDKTLVSQYRRDWLVLHALECVLLSFFKGGSTQTRQPIPLPISLRHFPPQAGKTGRRSG